MPVRSFPTRPGSNVTGMQIAQEIGLVEFWILSSSNNDGRLKQACRRSHGLRVSGLFDRGCALFAVVWVVDIWVRGLMCLW